MDIQLVSQDLELCRLCREVLAELPGSSALSAVAVEDLQTGADLHIFDFEPSLLIPQVDRSKCVFLVDRKDLPAFDEIAGETNILLKPVTRVALAIFLEQVLTGSRSSLQANVRLQEYDRDRTNFLARAVHDFRAPLTALSGYCSLLLDDPLGLDDTQREVLQRMHNSIQRLSRLASAMPLLSAPAQGKTRPDLHRGDPSEPL